MGRKSINRTGEKGINNFGSEMIIVNSYMKFNDKYKRNYTYVDVYFPEYNWTFKGVRYESFKNGNVKCPYERTVFGIGYVGEGKYKVSENGKDTKSYNTWRNMLQRCYNEKCQEKNPTYKGCTVCDEWHNFQNFAKWYEDNYYEIEGERIHLDKDILCKGNKIYTPETCVFVPQTINMLFTKRQNDRGESVIGTSYHKRDKKYQAYCSLINPKTGKSKDKYLGYYDTEIEAFEIYKYYKERNIKQVADYYRDLIPERLYMALYNYEVEITD
mgnify:FL=1|jgi:hypothetical protein